LDKSSASGFHQGGCPKDDLDGWPKGMRLIVRNERPHTGAISRRWNCVTTGRRRILRLAQHC